MASYGTVVDTLEGLAALPSGTWILDSGLHAQKMASGAWRYTHDGKCWEPEQFPVIVVGAPGSADDRCNREYDYHSNPHRGCILR
ncbi:MAG: hypothetical protein E6R04_08540 [Spirochaetes bacterium]|nr:MAG: hypothetical protein E6R04_08540 [Spirochaetota bacterium]